MIDVDGFLVHAHYLDDYYLLKNTDGVVLLHWKEPIPIDMIKGRLRYLHQSGLISVTGTAITGTAITGSATGLIGFIKQYIVVYKPNRPRYQVYVEVRGVLKYVDSIYCDTVNINLRQVIKTIDNYKVLPVNDKKIHVYNTRLEVDGKVQQYSKCNTRVNTKKAIDFLRGKADNKKNKLVMLTNQMASISKQIAELLSDGVLSDGVLSDDVLSDDVLSDDVLSDDVLSDDVLSDDVYRI